ncbi:MAG: PKD domain-containing protein [Candidatus Thermoplasmatota archaeon]|jgi:hypothetical protein|nr:PKD domain-containing protein [Candidatus Thermoplasmatota archaeon]MDP7264038.1 PKD domain-containing protein [Candidatus Thermoplasmatota archaeon]
MIRTATIIMVILTLLSMSMISNNIFGVTPGDIEDPVADAGTDMTVNQGDIVTFNGSASTDDVGVINYTWIFRDIDEKILYGEEVNYTFNNAGDFVVSLNVSDAAENWNTDNLTVTVIDLTAPTADAGEDIEVERNAEITFDGTNSIDNMGIINYTWIFNYNGSEINLYEEIATFVFEKSGNYLITLEVRDLMGNLGTDEFWVNVTGEADMENPVSEAGADKNVLVGSQVTLDGSASSDNVGINEWTWTFTYNGTERVLSGKTASFIFDIVGNYSITLSVADAFGNSDSDTIWVNVTETLVEDTEAPVAKAGADRTVDNGTLVKFDAGASTDNMGVINWTWKFTYNGSGHELYGKTVSFRFDITGNYTITLAVTDEAGNLDSDTTWINVTKPVGTDTEAPLAKAGGDRTEDAGAQVQFDGSASTDNVGVINYTWTFTYDGAVQKLYGEKPSFRFDITGNYSLTFSVSDKAGNLNESIFIVQVKEALPQPFTLGPFMDKDGNPVEGLDVTITIDSTPYTAKTDKNGKASFQNTPSPQNDDKVVVKQNGEIVYESGYSEFLKESTIADPNDTEDFLSRVPWLWVGVGGGGLLLIIIIIIVIKKRRDYDDDDDDDDYDYGEYIETKACHKCGELLATFDTKFCQVCGEDQDPFGGPTITIEEKLCVKCYVPVLPPNSPFCQNCGANQQSIAGSDQGRGF